MKIMRGRKMKIGIGNDHVAVDMKNEIKTIFNAISHCVCTNNNKWLY